ncbi:hypothetical protein LCGC14_3050680, partial [marine sediment metagenome]
MSKIDRYVKRYKLKIVEINKINLDSIYCQYHPEMKLENRIMNNSPHVELARLYYTKGLNWLEKNFTDTKYYKFQKNILKDYTHVPKKKIRLFDSLKQGYLRSGHEKDHILILNKSFISTRYGLNSVSVFAPEIFIGHHRA